MQKYCLLFVLCFPVLLYAQPVAVMLDKMNAVYTGVFNQMTIAVSDVSPEHLIVIPSQGEIVDVDSVPGRYLWRICEMTSSRAWLILADSSIGNAIDTLFFRVKRLPEPQFKARIVDPHHGPWGIAALYDTETSSKGWKAQVISFDATFLFKHWDAVVQHNQSGRFTGDLGDFLQRLTPGDAVHFYNIIWTAGCDPTLRRSSEILEYKSK